MFVVLHTRIEPMELLTYKPRKGCISVPTGRIDSQKIVLTLSDTPF